MKQIMGEGNDKQTDIQSKDATNHYLFLDPPCIRLRGHRSHGNLQCFLSFVHGKDVRNYPPRVIRQADTWKIIEEDPQNLSSMEHPAFHSKFLSQQFDVLQEGGPLLLHWNRVGIFILCEVALLKE